MGTHQLNRLGIAAAGNWILDKVKSVDVLPGSGMLANILSETTSSGGAPANVLADLSQLGAPFPLVGLGMIGDDEAGQQILERFRSLGVDVSQMAISQSSPTSYTDVMSKADTGERSFFHFRGANAIFGPEHVQIENMSCKILHLGYLLLLDRMDEEDAEFGTVAARFLHDAQQDGIETSIDLVSEESERFSRIIPPALKYVDYLFMNEIEASRTTGIAIRRVNQTLDAPALSQNIEVLARMGTLRLVVIHMPEGAVARTDGGSIHAIGSLTIPAEHIAGSTGAGDAFCAGMLHGLHEGFAIEKSLQLAICTATASLTAEDSSSGVMNVEKVLALLDKYPCRSSPLEVAR